MTKKDFQIIAEMLGEIIFTEEYLGKDVWACQKAINSKLKATNPKFDEEKFWGAVNKEILEIKGITK